MQVVLIANSYWSWTPQAEITTTAHVVNQPSSDGSDSKYLSDYGITEHPQPHRSSKATIYIMDLQEPNYDDCGKVVCGQ